MKPDPRKMSRELVRIKWSANWTMGEVLIRCLESKLMLVAMTDGTYATFSTR